MSSRELPEPIKRFRAANLNEISVLEELDRYGVNPVDQIMQEMASISSPKDRISIWFELLKYCAPKKKPQETIEEPERNLDVTPENLEDLWAKANRAVHGSID